MADDEDLLENSRDLVGLPLPAGLAGLGRVRSRVGPVVGPDHSQEPGKGREEQREVVGEVPPPARGDERTLPMTPCA